MSETQSGDTRPASGKTVVVLNAGVLHHFVADGLAAALLSERKIAVRHESGPSVALASSLRAGSKAADVFMSADAQVNALLMGAANANRVRWYVAFARNEVVLVYSPKGRYASEFLSAASGQIPWFELLQRPGLRLVRGDPNLDPLAYYTLFVVELSELHYGIPGLKRRILGDDLNPAQLSGLSLAGLESGEVDALFLYRSIALDRQLPFVALPDAVNLSDASQTESYARVSFTTNQGHTFSGGPIRLSATVLANAVDPEHAAGLIAYLLSPEGQRLLQDYHLPPTGGVIGGDPTAIPKRLQPVVSRPSSA